MSEHGRSVVCTLEYVGGLRMYGSQKRFWLAAMPIGLVEAVRII